MQARKLTFQGGQHGFTGFRWLDAVLTFSFTLLRSRPTVTRAD